VVLIDISVDHELRDGKGLLFVLERGPIHVRFLETFVRSGMRPRNGLAGEFYRKAARIVVLFVLRCISNLELDFGELE
jgi:hypothetical protein